jgi:hypothetical protein
MLFTGLPPSEERAMTVHDSWTLESLIEAYRQHQQRVLGRRDPTLRDYERFARSFLRFSLGNDPLDPTRITSIDVVQHHVAEESVFASFDEACAHCVAIVVAILRVLGYDDQGLPR